MARAEIYWNLARKCWSLRTEGKVEAHARSLVVANATFVVQDAGRRRVIREGRKNVHAFVTARPEFVLVEPRGEPNAGAAGARRVTYNPYQDHSFVLLCEDGSGGVERVSVEAADLVYLRPDGSCWAAGNVYGEGEKPW